MTDKEPIIIDEDVIKYNRVWLDNLFEKFNDSFGSSEIFIRRHLYALLLSKLNVCLNYIEKQNKQLQDKTQECEELKDQINIYKKMFDNSEFRVALTDIRTGERDIREQRDRRLTKENEELKERLERIEKDLKYQCVDCMNVKSDRYLKALEEIERVCIEDTRTFADGTELRYDLLNQILTIINKAKDGNKCQN